MLASSFQRTCKPLASSVPFVPRFAGAKVQLFFFPPSFFRTFFSNIFLTIDCQRIRKSIIFSEQTEKRRNVLQIGFPGHLKTEKQDKKRRKNDAKEMENGDNNRKSSERNGKKKIRKQGYVRASTANRSAMKVLPHPGGP